MVGARAGAAAVENKDIKSDIIKKWTKRTYLPSEEEGENHPDISHLISNSHDIIHLLCQLE